MTQSLKRPGDPGYRLVAAKDMHLKAGPRSSAFFKGGARSKIGPAVATAGTGPRAFSPGTPTLYNNVNKAGMGADSATPPDSTGAIGPDNYVEMDNSNITVYDRSLNLLSSASLDGFVGATPGVPFCDVQVQWDQAANRWLLAFLYCNTSSSTQRVFIAWSKTADPRNLLANNTIGPPSDAGTGGWCGFAFDNDPYLFDFPKLGHNAKFMIVGGNLYDESTPTGNPPFVSAGMEWASLPASNADTSCPPPTGGNSGLNLKNGDGTPAFTPVPVNNTTNAADDYVISAYDPAGNTSTPAGARNKLALWRLDSAGVLHAVNNLTVTTFDMPSAAQQPGSGFHIDTSDARLTQAVGDATTGIYTQHTVHSGAVSEVDWYEITASGGVATLAQQGAIALASTWVYNAAISPRFDGQGAAIFYNTSSGSSAIDIETKIRRPSTAAGAFEAGQTILATSAAPDTEGLSCGVGGFPCRWGDYAGASPDPVQTNVVWGTGEFNTASGSSPAWSDENFAVYAALRPNAATVTSARADGRGDSAITWTPSAFDPGTPLTSFEVVAFVGGIAGPNVVVNSGSADAVEFRGLTIGTTYTFEVFAMNAVGSAPGSNISGPVTITGAVVQSSPSPAPSRSPSAESSPAPPPSR